MNVIEAVCDECECETEGEHPMYQVFSVKEWLCVVCFADFIYVGEEE